MDGVFFVGVIVKALDLSRKETKIVDRILVFGVTILFLLGGCSTAAPQNGDNMQSIEVRDAWARPAAQGENGALYFVIRSAKEDELLGISSEVAEAVEMHESMMNGDVMEMHPLHSVPLKAGAEVKFEPGGLHVMLVSLKQDLKVGSEIEATLDFRDSADLTLRIPVGDTQP